MCESLDLDANGFENIQKRQLISPVDASFTHSKLLKVEIEEPKLLNKIREAQRVILPAEIRPARFTAFQKNDAVNALAAFFARTKHYIYVSTISAYQIVTPDGNTFLRSDRRPREVLETDMLPPPGPAGVPMHTYKKRLQAHSYGAGKYLIERKLLEAWDKIRFPFTSIRLPEVVGPGADDRHWFYQVWLATGLPVQLHPATEGVKFRMVYRDDAVRAIEDVINAGSDAHGEAYNIAQAELIDMPTYLQTVAEAMGRPAPEILYAPDEIR